MANFAPIGRVKIGRVPFDNSYRHTMTFPSREAQTDYFSSVCTKSILDGTYTYVRMNNAIRVQFNAEELYTYDYVMYQNANYGTKWFYAFIVGVNYVNENCTELVLELDVMQTWYFDYQLVETFVEREHVNDDTKGLHLNEEPGMPLQYRRVAYSEHLMKPAYAVLLINAYMHYVDSSGAQSVSNGVDSCMGDWVQDQYSACRYAIYNLNSANSRRRMSLDVQSLNLHGAAETIADAYTLPTGCFAVGEQAIDGEDSDLTRFPCKVGDNWTVVDGEVYTLKENTRPMAQTFTVRWPDTLGTYTPRNKKLLCYPYSYWEIGDFSGRVKDLRWEYFDDETCTVRQKLVASADCQGYVTAIDYNGVNNTGSGSVQMQNGVETFTFDYQNKIPWVYSAYQNWAAQNSMNNQLAILGGVGAMAFSMMPGIGAAARVLGKGAGAVAAAGAMHGQGAAAFAARENAYYNRKALSAFGEEASGLGIAGGLGTIAGTMANIDRMSKIPNTANGNTGGNSKIQNGYGGWYDAQMCLLPEYAAIVDDFFDMYGYQVDRVKVPNREGRPYWNYVKCQNSAHRGNVPSDMMSKINEIYDAGITFWHTADVGNYSLDNTI